MSPTSDRFGLRTAYQESDGTVSTTLHGTAIDELALHGYLCFSHVPEPRTIYQGVATVPRPPLATDSGALPNIGALLREAVARRLAPGDDPVGVFLSGGLDSSLVAALLVAAGARVHAFTLDFGAPFNAEVACAEAVAQHLGIPLRKVPAGPKEIARALDPTAAALPQPYGDGVVVPLYLLGQTAKDFVPSVWNGEGGDQLFGGWANKPMVAAYALGALAEETTEYLQTYHRFLGLTDALYTPQQRAKVGTIDASEWVRPALTAHPDLPLLHRLRAANIALKGAQNIGPRCAALTACHGLRVETPFFDDTLAAATFALPATAFLEGVREKAILKCFAATLLPEALVEREKRGMGVPTTEWCLDSGPLRRRVRGLLSPWRLRREGRFDRKFVGRLLAGDDPSPAAFRRRRIGEKLWTLVMWEVWREVHSL